MSFKKECNFSWFGQTWKCLRTSEVSEESDNLGGMIDLDKRTVYINDEYDEESFLAYLHHELTEGAMNLSACCFSRSFPDDKDLFIMDHAQMDLVSCLVRGAYEDIKKNIGLYDSAIEED